MPTVKRKAKKAKPKANKKSVKKPLKKPFKKPAAKAKKKPKKPIKIPVKSAAKKPAAKAARKPVPAAAPAPEPTWHLPREGEVLVGVVEDYLSHLEVILTTLKVPLAVGDAVSIRGFTTSIDQTVRSIQIEHTPVTQAAAGQAVGLKVDEKVRKNDHIFKKA